MEPEDMVRNWDAWADSDPMWAILTNPDKINNLWDAQEFFDTGEKKIANRMKWIQENKISLRRSRALDFGCGLGRLTNALASHFDEVHGVDVSSSMIKQARTFCRYPDKVKYIHNPNTNLSVLKNNTYDFIYSELVLQHIPPQYQLSYIRDFLSLLSTDGVAFFQTFHAVGWRALVPDLGVELYRKFIHKGRKFIPMYGIHPSRILAHCAETDCDLVHHESDPLDQFANRFCSDEYLIAKQRMWDRVPQFLEPTPERPPALARHESPAVVEKV